MGYVDNESTNDLFIGVMERQIKRLFVLAVALVIALIATNVCWLIYESQYDSYVITQDANTDGGGDVQLNGVGDINESTPNSED